MLGQVVRAHVREGAYLVGHISSLNWCSACVWGFGCECVCVFISTPRIVFERSAAANRACTHPKTWYMPNAQQVKMLIIGLHMCSLVQPTTKPTKQHPPRPPESMCFLSTTYDMGKIINTYLTQATYDHNVAGVGWVVGVERLCKGRFGDKACVCDAA